VSGRTPKSSVRAIAEAALSDLAQDRPVQIELPGGGSLRLDRRLPYLCVYRRTSEHDDAGTDQLINSETAFMIIPAGERRAAKAQRILRMIVEHLAKHFGSFLLIELWAGPVDDRSSAKLNAPANGRPSQVGPRFEIVVPGTRIPRVTIDALSKSLGRDALPYGGTSVVLSAFDDVAPPGLNPLVRMRELVAWNCFLAGLVVRPVYRHEDTRAVVPAVLRSISRSVHCGLEQAHFAFVHHRKALRPAHFHAPGHRSVVEEVLDIDRQLAEIDRSFDLLLQATPVNAESSWREFRRSRFEKQPVFYYRPLAIDPTLLKRRLYLIPVERIDDPTLSYLFRQKQDELDRQITLLGDVDSPRFLQESLQVYGGVSDWLLQHANEVLDRVPTRARERLKGTPLDATDFAKRAQQELGYYQQLCDDFSATVAVRDDMYSGMMVSGNQLLIGGRTRVAPKRVDALLQHEIGTHLVTRYNGNHQPFQQLAVGLAGYDGFQEGLAVLAEYLVGGLSRFRLRVLAARVVAAHALVSGASFVDTFRVLNRNLQFSQRSAYTIAMRIYRGGGLTKDAVYLRGLLQILRYLREGGELEPLFIGKVASAHLPLILELSAREIIKPPVLRPRYFDAPGAHEKLERLRAGMKVLDLLQ
jgi:uncharacterized protein (TIGR02421 family)